MNENAEHNGKPKEIRGRMRKLIIARKRQLQRDPKALRHAYQHPINDIQDAVHTLIAMTETLPTKEQIER